MKWFDDIDNEKVEKASEIPPQIDLPEPDSDAIMVKILKEPYQVEVKSRGDSMLVTDVERLAPAPQIEGTMILPKSLRFNIAKAIKRDGGDFTKTKLEGKVIRVWSIVQDGNKYYQAEIVPSA